MYKFNFYMPTKVLFGPGRLKDLHKEQLPGKKALIVTTNGTSVKKYGYLDRLEKELDLAGVAHELFAEIRPNPTRQNVMDGCDKEARGYMALANTLAGYYMMCTSAHSIEHTMGSFHPNLVHGAGLIMTAHAYYNFFAERKAAEEPMIKMAKAMGVENPASGKDFIMALDALIVAVGCSDLKMSDVGITEEELKLYPAKLHEVLGGDTTADPLPLSDEDYLTIYQNAWK